MVARDEEWRIEVIVGLWGIVVPEAVAKRQMRLCKRAKVIR